MMYVCRALLLLIAVTSCATQPENHSIELPQFDVSGLSQSEKMQLLSESYKFELEEVFQKIRPKLTSNEKLVLDQIKVQYSSEEHPFVFFADASDRKEVHLTAGGLTSLNLTANAVTIEEYFFKEDGWWFDFLLAVRAHVKQNNPYGMANWADPEKAMGCDIQPESMREYVGDAYVKRMNMLAFVVAHELGHVIMGHVATKKERESEQDYVDKLNRFEHEADTWAYMKLASMRVNPFDVVRAMYANLVIFGNENDIRSTKQYGNPFSRIRRVSEVYREVFPEHDYTNFDSYVDTLIEKISPSNDSDSVYLRIDELSREASFSDLYYSRRDNGLKDLFRKLCVTEPIVPQWIRDLTDQFYGPLK